MAIAGRSGSGKTTLLNLIGCLDQPDSGQIWIDEQNVAKLSQIELASLRARKIGYIFQTFNLLPVFTALENVEYPLLLLDYKKRERRQMCLEALQNVGLSQHIHKRPAQLSG